MTTRRAFLKTSGGVAAALSLLPGCTARFIETSGAYAAWDFPDPSLPAPLQVVHAGLLAANPHNTQPWRFAVGDDVVTLERDSSRWLGAMDPLWRELHIGLGCAVENMVLAAQASGHDPELVWLPDGPDADAVARISLRPSASGAWPGAFDLISLRHTNRTTYRDEPLPASVAQGLRDIAAEDELVQICVLDGDRDKERFIEATVAATEAIVADQEMSEASHAWIRYSKEEIERHKDGITLEAAGLSGLTIALVRATGGTDPDAEKAGEQWIRANSKHMTGSAFVVLSTSERLDIEQQLRCGRVFQRMALYLTGEGVDCQPLNQLAERQDRELEQGLRPVATDALSALLGEPSRAQMLFRVGFAKKPGRPSPRRQLHRIG